MRKTIGGGSRHMAKRLRLSLATAIAVVAAFVVALGVAVPAWATDTGTITIVPPTGTTSTTQTQYKIYKVFDVTYSNNAVNYRLMSGKTDVPNVSTIITSDGGTYNAASDPHFILDTAGNVHYGTEAANAVTTGDNKTTDITVYGSGNSGTTKTVHLQTKQAVTSDGATTYTTYDLTDAAIRAIAAYVASDNPTYTLTATGTTHVEQSSVPFGYWYVTTQTGTAVSIGTNNPNATINDKNVIPTVDKKITAIEGNEGTITSDGKAAIAEVGKKVTYTSTVTFNKGSKVIAFHDIMGDNLSYNGDAKVTINKVNSSTGATTDVTNSINRFNRAKGENSAYFPENTPYVVRDGKDSRPAADKGDTITVDFPDNLDQQAGTGEVIQAVITYTAMVTSDALTVDPANNTAKVTYGDNNASTQEDHTYVYNAKITVTKVDGSNSALAGAGFELSRTDGSTTYWYKYTAGNAAANPATTPTVEWVTDASQATELTTTSTTDSATGATTINNVLTFRGLPNGTYTLVETTTPAGYNRAADQTITINGVGQVTYAGTGSATAANGALYKYTPAGASSETIDNLNKAVTVINEAGSALPHTGGSGTVAFYVIGGALMVGALVFAVSKKRAASK